MSNAAPETPAGPPPEPAPAAPESPPLGSVHIETGQTIAYVKFEDALQEIFAVQVLPGVRHPDGPRLIADAFVVPDETLDMVSEPLRHPARVTQKPFVPVEIVR